MRTLLVHEIFHSIQGEGSRAGLPMAIVRLTGCALHCRWCDTRNAREEGRTMTLEEVRSAVLETACPTVAFTGGEPLLQPVVVPLLRRLSSRDGRTVLVETGGDQNISVLPRRVIAVLDVKCPGSGMAETTDLQNLQRLRPRDEVKFVLADRVDYEYARRLVRAHSLGGARVVLFSPVHGRLDPALLAGWILDDGLPVRLQIQLHKVLWPGEAGSR